MFSCGYAEFSRTSYLWSIFLVASRFLSFASLFMSLSWLGTFINYVRKKIKVFDTSSLHTCIHKIIYCKKILKRKIKYSSIFYLYLKEVRLIKKTVL